METIRIQNGQTERVEVEILDAGGNPLTGLSDVLLSIRRISDDFWLDFNDLVFKSSGWITRQLVMTEVDVTYDTGKYYYSFSTSGYSDDTYLLRVDCVSGANVPQFGELKVGDFVDSIDAAISSRSTLTAGAAADAVLDEVIGDSDHVTPGTFGYWFYKLKHYLLNKKDVGVTSAGKETILKDDGSTSMSADTKKPAGTAWDPDADGLAIREKLT